MNKLDNLILKYEVIPPEPKYLKNLDLFVNLCIDYGKFTLEARQLAEKFKMTREKSEIIKIIEKRNPMISVILDNLDILKEKQILSFKIDNKDMTKFLDKLLNKDKLVIEIEMDKGYFLTKALTFGRVAHIERKIKFEKDKREYDFIRYLNKEKFRYKKVS